VPRCVEHPEGPSAEVDLVTIAEQSGRHARSDPPVRRVKPFGQRPRRCLLGQELVETTVEGLELGEALEQLFREGHVLPGERKIVAGPQVLLTELVDRDLGEPIVSTHVVPVMVRVRDHHVEVGERLDDRANVGDPKARVDQHRSLPSGHEEAVHVDGFGHQPHPPLQLTGCEPSGRRRHRRVSPGTAGASDRSARRPPSG
jgi:hypothetical protein